MLLATSRAGKAFKLVPHPHSSPSPPQKTLIPHDNQIKPRTMTSSTSSWSCKKCTFLNPPPSPSSLNPTCKVCLNPPSPPRFASSSSASEEVSKWACKACTFLNSYRNNHCEVCDTRANRSTLSNFDDIKDISADLAALDGSIGKVFWPLRKCDKRKNPENIEMDNNQSSPTSSSLKILTYNVWFREDLEIYNRMRALGELVQHHSPHVICFQEVTPNIYEIFQQSCWWKQYRCSVSSDTANLRPYFCMLLSKVPVSSFCCKPFKNSVMGRELCIVDLKVEGNKHLVIATSHLESPTPAPPKWDQMYSKERVEQASEAVKVLDEYQNVVFGGDMNWDDKLDGDFPLCDGWIDAWKELKFGEDGWTYDTKSNPMLSGNRKLQKRLDRFLCKLDGFKITGVDMIGTEAIPGLTYSKKKKVRKEMEDVVLPVLPSDHFGLLLTVDGN